MHTCTAQLLNVAYDTRSCENGRLFYSRIINLPVMVAVLSALL